MMRHMVAVETGEVLPRAGGVDGVEDGVAVAVESFVGTDKRHRESRSNYSQKPVFKILYYQHQLIYCRCGYYRV